MEWLKFGGVILAGMILSGLIMHIIMGWCLNPKKVLKHSLERARFPKNKWKEKREENIGSGLQIPVGALEIALYATSIAYGEPGFIAVWFATKYVASWRGWTSDPVGRTFYNRSLFGSGLNIVFGVITGWVALVLSKPPFPDP